MIKVGDALPSVKLRQLGPNGMVEIQSDQLFAGTKGILFGLPGAFTPGCSAKHVPGYVEHLEALKAKGVTKVVCVSVNDAFVMAAWAKDRGAEGKLELWADGSGDFTRAIGLDTDLSGMGLGVRSKRYAMVVDNNIVTALELDESGAVDKSAAAEMMKHL